MQHSTTRQAEQKTCAKLDHHWSKNAHFFVCKRTGFVNQELRDFAKMTLTRRLSHWLWLESIDSVKNLTSVESPICSTWLKSSQSHQKSWLESRYWLVSRYHWSEVKCPTPIPTPSFRNLPTPTPIPISTFLKFLIPTPWYNVNDNWRSTILLQLVMNENPCAQQEFFVSRRWWWCILFGDTKFIGQAHTFCKAQVDKNVQNRAFFSGTGGWFTASRHLFCRTFCNGCGCRTAHCRHILIKKNFLRNYMISAGAS